ncbi:MAG: hypothetical protein IT178_13365 [Acidobacteria bacterium]|nr:hypothetical protein [Acidobacteriota bacterium]
MSTEHNLEYGPTPPGAQYEHTDIDPSIGYSFAVWLTVAVVLSLGLVYGILWMFESNQAATDAATQKFPLAAGLSEDPPAPRLQTQPFKDVYLLNQGTREKLHSYGWTDQASGLVHIPIERAMELTLQQLPIRAGEPGVPDRVVQDSSGGRTTAVR